MNTITPQANGSDTRIIPVCPVAKPRMSRRDKWQRRPVVIAYRAYKDELRKHLTSIDANSLITFVMPMPKSWNRAKRAKMAHLPHRQRPDLDNMIKGLWDALYEDDATLAMIFAQKIWGSEGCIMITPLANLEVVAINARIFAP